MDLHPEDAPPIPFLIRILGRTPQTQVSSLQPHLGESLGNPIAIHKSSSPPARLGRVSRTKGDEPRFGSKVVRTLESRDRVINVYRQGLMGAESADVGARLAISVGTGRGKRTHLLQQPSKDSITLTGPGLDSSELTAMLYQCTCYIPTRRISLTHET